MHYTYVVVSQISNPLSLASSPSTILSSSHLPSSPSFFVLLLISSPSPLSSSIRYSNNRTSHAILFCFRRRFLHGLHGMSSHLLTDIYQLNTTNSDPQHCILIYPRGYLFCYGPKTLLSPPNLFEHY